MTSSKIDVDDGSSGGGLSEPPCVGSSDGRHQPHMVTPLPSCSSSGLPSQAGRGRNRKLLVVCDARVGGGQLVTLVSTL
jgi:hypothetical protein